MFSVKNLSSHDRAESILSLLDDFLPFFQESSEDFSQPVGVYLLDSETDDDLGPTAYYSPEEKMVAIFVTDRHPKDILRSVSHELVHHCQQCRGDLVGNVAAEGGYAQTNEKLREMEREAYERGNLIFRDWEDGVKYGTKRPKNR